MKNDKYTTNKEIDHMKLELEEARNKTNSKGSKIIKLSLNLIIYLLLFSTLISVLLSKYSGDTPQIFGFQLYRIKSSSMEPTFKVGSIILTREPTDASSIEVGTVVTFSQANNVITHRVIEVITDDGVKYRTKGDNPLNSPDLALLSPENVKAVFVMKLY